jgi:hypothetical protein
MATRMRVAAGVLGACGLLVAAGRSSPVAVASTGTPSAALLGLAKLGLAASATTIIKAFNL